MNQYELSFHQERLAFIDVFEAGHLYDSSPTYHNIVQLLEIEGRIDADELERFLNTLLMRHQALRMRIHRQGGDTWQTAGPANLTLSRFNASPETAQTLAIQKASRSFDLHGELLIRAALLNTGPKRSMLSLGVHHIVADRTSMRELVNELLELYSAKAEKRPPKLPEKPAQFSDYIAWQRRLPKQVLDALLFYWKHQLRGGLQALELPLKRPRPAVHVFTSGRHSFPVQLEAHDALEQALTAFIAVLRRYTSHEEIVVGTAAPCRSQQGMQGLAGPIDNLLVLRNRCGGHTTLNNLLERTKRTLSQALKHREMPFDRLVLALDPPKDLSRTALFDVLFSFDDSDAGPVNAGPLRVQRIETNLGYGKYDLHLHVYRRGDSWAGELVYNADYLDAWLIEQMMRHYVVLLGAMTADRSQLVDDVPLLSQEEESRLRLEWNTTEARYPREKTIHRLFEERVSRTPNHIAVTADGAHLTYRELNKRANRLAHHLLSLGAAPDTCIALYLERSSDMIVAILAVLKAGAAYAPIDPTYPRERVQFMLQDCAATIVIATSAHRDLIAAPGVKVIALDKSRTLLQSYPTADPRTEVTPGNLAYVIYTSGSTGRPKGALIEHSNVVRLLLNDRMPFAFSDRDVWPFFHSYAFDFAVWEIFGALLYGGRLVIVSDSVRRDSYAWLELIVRERVSVLNQTPSAFDHLLREAAADPGLELPSLRYVIFGGEVLEPAKLAMFHSRFSHVELINMYGITETCVHVTWKRITQADIAGDSRSIGLPIPTTTAYVMDSQQRLMPLGVPGELCVGGLGVGRGYLNRDKLTQQRFVVHPFKPDERLYRSGDLVKRLESGELIYLGRMDEQVQLRGFRIELGEIEARLREHSAVADAVVVLREDGGSGPRLVAYYIAAGTVADERPAVDDLRAHLQRMLPAYMVPAAFVALDRLPLTINGKLDRRALPAPDHQSHAVSQYEAPEGEMETLLAGIWCELLGVARVGRNDDFFSLGGHSLLIMRLVVRVEAELGVRLPLQSVFENPRLAALAEIVVDAQLAQFSPADVARVAGSLGWRS